jgi:maleylpyruvate isomerase
MKLYGYWRSSATWRVRIGLSLKGITYETVPVHLVHGDQRSPDHRARNPLAQVPVLELEDGTRLTQSLAILSYLDARFSSPPLLPSEPLARARAWEAAEIINSGIQPLQNMGVLQDVEALGGDRTAFGRRAIERGLAALEAITSRFESRFLVADFPTVADICLVPQLYNARRFHVDLAPFPRLTDVESRCIEWPAFAAAHPDVQPDAS